MFIKNIFVIYYKVKNIILFKNKNNKLSSLREGIV